MDLLNCFVRDVEAGRHLERGWPANAYRISKLGLNAFTRILARELAGSAVRVNAVSPGWVRAAMILLANSILDPIPENPSQVRCLDLSEVVIGCKSTLVPGRL